jgi:hypothetical protein
MTSTVNIRAIYSAKAAINRECDWLLTELSTLEQQRADDGRSTEVQTLVAKLQESLRHDVGDEIDSLASRLGQAGANVRAPARMIIRWLHADIRPLADLAAPGFEEGAHPTPLLHLLMVAAGELVAHWGVVCDELKPIEPDPFGPIPDGPSK